MALWGGRFSGVASEKFKAFNDSLPVDYKLWEEDIVGSIAWSKAIHSVGVLSDLEQSQLESALVDLQHKVAANPKMILESDAEDIHSWVETQLIDVLGDLGKKLHTGRSRNDQVATDLKLWCKKTCEQLLANLVQLQDGLVALADRESQTVLPGYTHLQRAQPITFAHWCLAYVEMFNRDIGRVQEITKRLDTCPLGSGALAGTAYPINRHKLAQNLGFRTATRNSLDAVSDRDHVLEILSAASISMMHLSRFAEDLIFYNSGEAGFIELSDAVTSGSSLMPQKKNPDALELIRGRCGKVYGMLSGMMMTMKALPLAYNKDMQEDKQGLFEATECWSECLEMATLVLEGLQVNHGRALSAAQQGYSNATELADYLVSKQIPFREAHDIVGQVVVYAIKEGKALEEFSLQELQSFSDVIAEDVYQHLSIESCLDKRQAFGGTSPNQVKQALDNFEKDGQLQGHPVFGGADGTQIQIALQQAKQRLNAQIAGVMSVRMAKLSDVEDICRILEHWTDKGETLPRTKDNIIHDIQDFAVAVVDGKIIGCASLYIYQTGLAEMRSVAVDPAYHTQGQGTAMVQFLLQKAHELELARVIVLTRVPEFFSKMGFAMTQMEKLPEKVMKDCDLCAKKHACDEVAMDYLLITPASKTSERIIFTAPA